MGYCGLEIVSVQYLANSCCFFQIYVLNHTYSQEKLRNLGKNSFLRRNSYGKF